MGSPSEPGGLPVDRQDRALAVDGVEPVPGRAVAVEADDG
jgi:hypothetical protein